MYLLGSLGVQVKLSCSFVEDDSTQNVDQIPKRDRGKKKHSDKGLKMVLSATVPLTNGGIKIREKMEFHHPSIRKFEYGRMQNTDLASWKTRSRAIRVLANPNASPQRERTKKEVIMVDPLEAKRLAAKQMEEIKAKERFKRRRQIEAINGAWAMIGLTVGLVIEGHTGLSIPSQLASYLAAIVRIFTG